MALEIFATFNSDLPDQFLRSTDASYESGIPQDSRINDATPIHLGHAAVVYKGSLVRSDGGSAEEVVLKFVRRSDLNAMQRIQNEYRLYKKELGPLQGIAVPRCYGLFKALDGSIVCLILQYCGESLTTQFSDLDYELLLDILDNLLEVHYHGVQHNDMAERNVVVKDGKPFIIDFDHAEPHVCEHALNVVEGAVAPCSYYFKCEEIHEWCYVNGIWRPGSFPVGGIVISEKYATSVEALVEIARQRGSFRTTHELRMDATKVMRIMELIKANKGRIPRPPTIKALMREVEAEFGISKKISNLAVN